ncbi:MAG: O-antigen ligase family protein, partial [Paracoccaceae bacterium]
MSTPAAIPYRLSAQQLISSHSRAAPRLILALLTIRWLAGIADNYGARGLSEAAAITLLAGLACLLLLRMRLARASIFVLAGLLAWLFVGTLSLVANPDADLREAVALLSLLLLYALFSNAATSHLRSMVALTGINRFLQGFVVIGAALSLMQIATGTGFVEIGREAAQRAFGSDVHPVSFAIQMLAALVALEVIRIKRAAGFSALHAALLGLGVIAIYLTSARTAWVMAMLTVGYVLVMRGNPARRLGVLIVLVSLALALLLQSDRFSDLASLPLFWANFSAQDVVFDWRYVDNSVSWRIVNWSFGIQQAMQQPLLGFGPGQSATASQFSLEMHNIFLETVFEGGMFGLAALLLTLAGLIRLHRGLPRATAPDRHARTLTNGFAISLLLAVTFSTSFVDQLMSFLIY